MRPRPLDPSLGNTFRVSEALAAGASRKRLSASDLTAPFHGVRAVPGQTSIDAYLPLMRPTDRFSHTTAAQLWGCPVPFALESALHVSSSIRPKPESKGCIGHASPGTATRRNGYVVSDPAQLVIECGAILLLDDLVAIIDHLILDPRILDPHDLRPYANLDDIAHRVRASRAYGVRRARQAVELSRQGVESPMETRLRLILHRAGIAEPSCGYELCRPDGRTVGWFDLAWREQKVIAEYDGDQHRTSRAQYERDIRRFDDAADLGWRVVRVRASGIRKPEDTVARVRSALARG